MDGSFQPHEVLSVLDWAGKSQDPHLRAQKAAINPITFSTEQLIAVSYYLTATLSTILCPALLTTSSTSPYE